MLGELMGRECGLLGGKGGVGAGSAAVPLLQKIQGQDDYTLAIEAGTTVQATHVDSLVPVLSHLNAASFSVAGSAAEIGAQLQDL